MSGDLTDNRRDERQEQIFYQGRIRHADGDSFGKVWDLSLGGMRLVAAEAVSVGTSQCIGIELPDEAENELSVQVKATCVWSRPSALPGYHENGYAFTNLTEEQVRLLEALMAVASF